jgi:hypothetical protein
MHRLVPIVLLFFAAVPGALAWTWPVRGPVVQAFDFDQAHPYAAGQHRGIAIDTVAGSRVHAPVGGTISFAGTVPGSGPSLTIRTADGLAVTLTTLGSLGVARGDAVAEGDAVGTAGDDPVHLGVREAANEQGYLDPLRFLPLPSAPAPTPAPAPTAAPAPAPAPTAAPAPVAAPASPVASPGAAPAPAPAAPVSTAKPTPAEVAAPPSVPAASAGADLSPARGSLATRQSGLRIGTRGARAPAAGGSAAVHAPPALQAAAVQATLPSAARPPAERARAVNVPAAAASSMAARSTAEDALAGRSMAEHAMTEPTKALPRHGRSQPAGLTAIRVSASANGVRPASASPPARRAAPEPVKRASLHAQPPSAPPGPGRPFWQMLLGILSSIGAGIAAVVALVRIPLLRRGRLAT